jgi:hypothetical protein
MEQLAVSGRQSAGEGMGMMRRGSLVRLSLAAVLAGVVLPQVVLTSGGMSPAALVGVFAIGFAAGLLVDRWRWLAVIPVAAAIGVAARYLTTIDFSPFGVNAGVPRGGIYAFVAFVAAMHAAVAMGAAMIGAIATRRFE